MRYSENTIRIYILNLEGRQIDQLIDHQHNQHGALSTWYIRGGNYCYFVILLLVNMSVRGVRGFSYYLLIFINQHDVRFGNSQPWPTYCEILSYLFF
jgi:hypothetical protein